jgi:apolipoprotein N-acyltransferase
VRWGDWVGRAGVVFLALLFIFGAWRKWAPVGVGHAGSSSFPFAVSGLDAFPAKVIAMPMGVRFVVALLRVFARGSLLWIGAMMLLSDQFQSNTLAQIRWVSSLFLLPEAVAWCVLQAFSGTLSIENGALVLTRGQRRMTLALTELRAITLWRLPLPGLGVTLHMAPDSNWPRRLMLAYPTALRSVWLQGADLAGGGAATQGLSPRFMSLVQAWQWASASRFASLWAKYLLLPLLLALPAFRLHQHIAYGGSFGEYYTFGLQAYLTTLALWWAAWAIGVLLCAAALRAAIEVATLIVVVFRPELTLSVRVWLERFGLVALYVGVPGWLVLRAFGN